MAGAGQGRDARGRFTSSKSEPDVDFDDLIDRGKDALAGDELTAAFLALAADAVEYAKSIAPVGDPKTDPHSGAYRDAIVVEQRGGIVYVAFNDPKSHWIEYGTEDIPKYREGAVRARTENHFNNG